ncbi:MAG: hypothetical protein AB8C84_01270 [Oligoflexales bacterium]
MFYQHSFSYQIKIFILSVFLSPLVFSCDPDHTSSDRQTKKDQIRSYALSKKAELEEVIGAYHGTIYDNKGRPLQELELWLESQDRLFKDSNSIDAIRTPTLNGYVLASYSSGSGKKISYKVINSEYDESLQQLTLELENSIYGVLSIEGIKENDHINGSWVSGSTGLHGTLSFAKKKVEDSITQSNPLDASLPGVFMRDEATQSFHHAEVLFQTYKEQKDSFLTSITLILYNGPYKNHEFQSYRFDDIQIHIMNGNISAQDTHGEITLYGRYTNGIFEGQWHSLTSNENSTFYFDQNFDKQKKFDLSILQEESTLSGTYYSTIPQEAQQNTHLPENISINLKIIPLQDSTKKWEIHGGVRFYIGSYDSQEYLEANTQDIHYNPFTRVLSLKTEKPYSMSFSGVFQNGVWEPHLSYAKWNEPAILTFTPHKITDSKFNLEGLYHGYIQWDQDLKHQHIVLQMTTSKENDLKISGHIKVYLNDKKTEYIFYKFSRIDFNPETKISTAFSDDQHVVLKFEYHNGEIHGTWTSDSGTLSGSFVTSQDNNAPPVQNDLEMKQGNLTGVYQGKLKNLSEETQLPENFTLSFVSSQNISNPHGLSITGHIRFYFSPYQDSEYVEYVFQDIEYDFCTKKLSGYVEDLKLSFIGIVDNQEISADLFFGAAGKIATLEGKYE